MGTQHLTYCNCCIFCCVPLPRKHATEIQLNQWVGLLRGPVAWSRNHASTQPNARMFLFSIFGCKTRTRGGSRFCRTGFRGETPGVHAARDVTTGGSFGSIRVWGRGVGTPTLRRGHGGARANESATACRRPEGERASAFNPSGAVEPSEHHGARRDVYCRCA